MYISKADQKRINLFISHEQGSAIKMEPFWGEDFLLLFIGFFLFCHCNVLCKDAPDQAFRHTHFSMHRQMQKIEPPVFSS